MFLSMLHVPVNNFSVMFGKLSSPPGLNDIVLFSRNIPSDIGMI